MTVPRGPKVAFEQIVEDVDIEAAPRAGKHTQLGVFGLQVFDRDSGALAPGYEEFARQAVLTKSAKEAWIKSFNEPFNQAVCDDLVRDPVMRLRVGQLHAQKLAIDAAVRRNRVRAEEMTERYVAENIDMAFRLAIGQSVAIQGEEGEEPTLLPGQPDLKAALRAMELVGKWKKMWDGGPSQVAPAERDMTDDEIEAEGRLTEERIRLIREAMPALINAPGSTFNVHQHYHTEGNGHDFARESATIIDQEPSRALTTGGGGPPIKRAATRPVARDGAAGEEAAPRGFVPRLRP